MFTSPLSKTADDSASTPLPVPLNIEAMPSAMRRKRAGSMANGGGVGRIPDRGADMMEVDIIMTNCPSAVRTNLAIDLYSK